MISNGIPFHRTEVFIPCVEQARVEGLDIIQAYDTSVNKLVITPSVIELNEKMVAFGYIKSMI